LPILRGQAKNGFLLLHQSLQLFFIGGNSIKIIIFHIFLFFSGVIEKNVFTFFKRNFRFLQLEENTRFKESYTCFGCEAKTGVVRILVIFQDRPVFRQIIQKVYARAAPH